MKELHRSRSRSCRKQRVTMLSKEEQELRRLLHTGGSAAGVNLPIKHSDREIPDILAAVQALAGTGRINLPLQHCLAAREGGLADSR